jgi:hypothetical protein
MRDPGTLRTLIHLMTGKYVWFPQMKTALFRTEELQKRSLPAKLHGMRLPLGLHRMPLSLELHKTALPLRPHRIPLPVKLYQPMPF